MGVTLKMRSGDTRALVSSVITLEMAKEIKKTVDELKRMSDIGELTEFLRFGQ